MTTLFNQLTDQKINMSVKLVLRVKLKNFCLDFAKITIKHFVKAPTYFLIQKSQDNSVSMCVQVSRVSSIGLFLTPRVWLKKEVATGRTTR